MSARRVLNVVPSADTHNENFIVDVWGFEALCDWCVWPKDFRSSYLKQGFCSLGYPDTLAQRGTKKGKVSSAWPQQLASSHLLQQPYTHTLTGPVISMTMLCCRGVSMVRLGMQRGAPCECVFTVARALPLLCPSVFVFVCVSVRRSSRAAGVFVVMEEGCSLGTLRLRHWAPFRQESQWTSHPAHSLGPPQY